MKPKKTNKRNKPKGRIPKDLKKWIEGDPIWLGPGKNFASKTSIRK